MNLRISRKQQAFIDATEDEVLFGGAAGGGKSYGQIVDAFLYGLRYHGSKQLILRRSYPELERSIIRTVMELYPAEVWSYNAQKHSGRLRGGSIVDFGYINTEGDLTQYQSAEYDVIRFDELTHFTEYMYTYLISRLRGANAFPKQIKSSTNPGGVGHGWVKQRFIDVAPPDTTFDTGVGTRRFIPSKVQDNMFLMRKDPEYLRRLQNLNEEDRKALLYGSWDVFAGQYFREWDRGKHVCEPFEIPPAWRRFRAMDWGYSDPCCVLWFAVGADGRVYVYRELYENRTLSRDVAARMRAMSGKEEIAYTAASPDAWAERGQSDIEGVTIAEVFSRNGAPLIKADNTRVSGWQRVREYLADAPDGAPRLQIFSTCLNLIRTLPEMVYDARRVEDVADGLEDHACEALRYGLMSRPSPNAVKEPPKRKPYNPLESDPPRRGGFYF